MQKILVLGGSGLVGSVFANHSQQYYDLHLTYTSPYCFLPKYTTVESSIRSQRTFV